MTGVGDPASGSASPTGDGDTVPWRALCTETAQRLGEAGVAGAAQEARWLLEEVSGLEGTEWAMGMEEPATQRGVARLDDLVARRLAGEPIQYVLGRWAFRALDLLCDRRVLIPRPETEQVVEVALAELDRVLVGRPRGHHASVVDLGAGSGAIALSIAGERPGTDVWAVDASADAVAVVRANLAGLGLAGMRVRVAEGSWFEALPDDLRGTLDLVVSNPPYVRSLDDLPPAVRDWEPVDALVPPGGTGLAAYEHLVPEAAEWLAPGGAITFEIGSDQASDVAGLLESAGYRSIRVVPDLAGLDRAVAARRPS